ncbi:hypothetical protein ACIQU4_36130 [Streptomyces sp. NPDC090741]|uniref:hypothetical protein n=1 Tax=Streptomyces sp. NPDC090741 TaxID=3365967 RepID=UPI0038038E37
MTVPFEEEGDAPETERMAMAMAVGEMAAAFGMLHTRAEFGSVLGTDTRLEDVLSEGTTHRHGGSDVYVSGEDRVYPATAKPQATGGVSLERMLALFEAVVGQELPLESPSNPADVELLGDEAEERAVQDRARRRRPEAGCRDPPGRPALRRGVPRGP